MASPSMTKIFFLAQWVLPLCLTCATGLEVAQSPSQPAPATPQLFFFQAEDGIRGHCVTGVQTCARPISFEWSCESEGRENGAHRIGQTVRHTRRRSEERRVGKECRSRWPPHH